MKGIDQFAGNFRPAAVAIKGSNHIPIAASDVPRYVEEMLLYVEENWSDKSGIHLCAYVMWRLNWIHPFADGNGRTSRILSYMILCGRLGQKLPGKKSIPEQIARNKQPYYDALDKADHSWRSGRIDVSQMENLLESYLANQLVDVHEQATNGSGTVGMTRATTGFHNHSKETAAKRTGLVGLIEAHPVMTGGVFLLVATALTIFFG